MLKKTIATAAVTFGIIGLLHAASDMSTHHVSCCVEHADCCAIGAACCEAAVADHGQAVVVSVDQSTNAEPSCCAKRAYCCKIQSECCRDAAATPSVR